MKLSTDVMGNRDRTCKMACAPNLKDSVKHKYTSEETFRRYESVFDESILGRTVMYNSKTFYSF